MGPHCCLLILSVLRSVWGCPVSDSAVELKLPKQCIDSGGRSRYMKERQRMVQSIIAYPGM